jgi:hypothetical protein
MPEANAVEMGSVKERRAGSDGEAGLRRMGNGP